MSRCLAALLALAAAAGCTRKIPGTEIDDTKDNRAIAATIDAWRRALDARDANGIVALVSDQYFDDAGTGDPADDLDRSQLPKALADTLSRLPSVKLEVAVTRIEVDGDKAAAFMFFDSRYRVATPRGEIAKRDADVSRMTFRREAGGWRISSGL